MALPIARRSFLALGGATVLSAAATRRARAAGQSLKLAYATEAGFYHHAAAQAFKADLEATTGGRLTVELFPGGQLGGEAQILEAVRAGTIEAYLGTCGALSNFVPELGIVDLPYIWRDTAHAMATLDGGVGTKLAAAAPPKGFVVASFWPAGRRDVYGNVKIEKPDDFKGVKIRTLQTPVYLATFRAFGALPTPIAWPETYGALQQGVIDAAETALSAMLAASQQEVVKYIVLTGHAQTVAAVAFGKPWFDGLAPDLQKAIPAALAKGRAVAMAAEDKSFAGAIDRLKAAGKSITTPDLTALAAVVQKTVLPQFAGKFDPALLSQITGT
jgi:tripartite ATP-independent transporter DctP family solute receptor